MFAVAGETPSRRASSVVLVVRPAAISSSAAGVDGSNGIGAEPTSELGADRKPV
ncbi:hypothetical protein [Nocardia sp. NPDC051463]|uniref:hypothetical protein n=1 Tax=Nocardia sp. NPDC051463 TaxID=3154845 RepID=UPI00344BA376